MSTKTKDKKAAQDAEDGEEVKAGGGKKKLFVLLALVLVAAGAGAWFFLFAGSGEAEAEEEEPVAGEVLPLDPVTVNLAGGGYLKIGISLQTTEAAAGDGHGGGGVDGSEALDLIISTYSQAQPADVTGAREALKESLEQQIVEAYTDEEGAELVMGIYFTEYVTQ